MSDDRMSSGSKWNLNPEDGVMRNISTLTAIQTSTRRACIIAREFTGIEVMPDEMGAAAVDSLSCLKHGWDNFQICKRKPDSIVNFASCMSVMEWCHSIKKADSTPYSLSSNKLSSEMDMISIELEYLFPGCMSIKNATQCLYDGISVTAEGCERNGWQWTKKLNEKFVALMSLYPILRAFAKYSVKMAEIQEALSHKEKRKD